MRQTFSDVPIVALTATADRLTREDIQKQLALSDPVVFISSFDRPNLSLDVKRGYQKKDKDRAILELIARHPDDCGIIYCLSKKTTESVAEMLRGHDIAAVAYHAGFRLKSARGHRMILSTTVCRWCVLRWRSVWA